jgi:hypothetical protein
MSLSVACQAGDGIPQAAPAQGPQVMIYFRQPLWAPGAHRIYGLRIDQSSAPSSTPNALGSNPLRRREILSFEIGQHADMRVEFARRLFWDVNRQEFGLGSFHSSVAFQLAPRPVVADSAARPHP